MGSLPIGVDYELPPHVQTACDHVTHINRNTQGCPISEGTDVFYNFEFPVNENYPQLSNLAVDVSLIDQHGAFWCARVRIRTVRL